MSNKVAPVANPSAGDKPSAKSRWQKAAQSTGAFRPSSAGKGNKGAEGEKRLKGWAAFFAALRQAKQAGILGKRSNYLTATGEAKVASAADGEEIEPQKRGCCSRRQRSVGKPKPKKQPVSGARRVKESNQYLEVWPWSMTAPTEPCPATSVSRKSTKRKVKIRAARLVWALILLGGILYAFLYRQAVMAWFYHTEYFPSDGGMYTIGAPNCASEMDPSRCELPLASCSDQTCPAYSEAAYAQCPDGLSDSTDARNRFEFSGVVLKAFAASICKICPSHNGGETCAIAAEQRGRRRASARGSSP